MTGPATARRTLDSALLRPGMRAGTSGVALFGGAGVEALTSRGLPARNSQTDGSAPITADAKAQCLVPRVAAAARRVACGVGARRVGRGAGRPAGAIAIACAVARHGAGAAAASARGLRPAQPGWSER